MTVIKLIKSEIKEYIEYVLRWVPGGVGARLRYFYYRPRFGQMGLNVNILQITVSA